MASNPPLTMSLLDLRTAAKQRASMENSPFISDAEWNANINSSYARLYDRLVTLYGEDYFVKDPAYTFTTDGTSESYPLPTDFYKLLGVDVQMSSGPQGWMPIRPFQFQERNRYNLPLGLVYTGSLNLRYRLTANKLWLIPTAASGQTIQIRYVPRLTPLVNDTDIADGYSGWLDLVTVDAAIKALRKQQLDASELMADKAELIKEIEDAAVNRDAALPQTVGDNRHAHDPWPFLGFGGDW